MKTHLHAGFRLRIALLALFVIVVACVVEAFPPAPHHTIFGTVRDELGDPLYNTNAQIILETTNGTRITSRIILNIEPNANYRLTIPMDAGITGTAYKPTALNPLVSFRIKVKIGQAIYLPIEMLANYSQLGKPTGRTRLDLTLGEDSDGDGLPDAWERALITIAGGNMTLQDIRPNDDFDGDGLSNLAEYIAGTYAFDSQDGLRLNMVAADGSGVPTLEFLAIRGRTYTVHGSANLLQWAPVQFRILALGPSAPLISNYRASDVQMLRIQVPPETNAPPYRFFRLMLE